MTKIDIFSGFLGAGKTTLIKKLISEAYAGEKLVLIENEFGEIGVDGAFLKDSGVEISEMNSGCICCSLTGDFRTALTQVVERFAPDRILIEPSGVGKLSEVAAAVESVHDDRLKLNGLTAVVDAARCRIYMRNFGEFFNDQAASASCIVLSRTGNMAEDVVEKAVDMLRTVNPGAVIITTPWDQLDGKAILSAIEGQNTLSAELERLLAEHEHDDDDDDECCCGHHHHDDDHEHHHHHDDDDDECCCGHHHHDDDHEHHHHHDDDDDDDECCCGHHHHDDDHEHHHHHHHHHGHDADEVFASWGTETAKKYTSDGIRAALDELASGKYGDILRAKGLVEGEDGQWIYFDYVPDEPDIRFGAAAVTGRICVIGAHLDEHGTAVLFGREAK